MCGIAGMISCDGSPADAAVLRRMTDALAHRGPDGEGFYVEDAVGLGHRRLAIIDLATGHQPMASADGRMWITYNGEIYNFRELRRELAARGQRFRTASDTEVLLAAYEAWGFECLSRLRGMFAFAIWDEVRGRLFLARDRLGIKPLVYAWNGRRLLFASEAKAILQDPAVGRELDWEALGDYLVHLYVPSPRTIFTAIRKLPPASYLVLDVARGAPEIHRYWTLSFAPDPRPTVADWREGLRAQLDEAVRLHLVADVPVGAFLSGGMDSSTVVALMAHAGREPVRTFSIGFDEAGFDELAYARQIARRYGTRHSEFVVKPDALDVLPGLVEQFDEPFGDSSAVPAYYVARITSEQVRVALSGDGGDESFAGYRRYARALAFHSCVDRPPLSLARPLLGALARVVPAAARGRGYLELCGADPIDRYFRMVTYRRAETLHRLLTHEAQRRLGGDRGALRFREIVGESGAADYVAALQAVDVRTYLPDDILTKVDRTSMLVSLETRVPLLDHVLVEYVATMPTALKLRDGTGKAILKAAMRDDLPSDILERRKMGFGVPLAGWLRADLGQYTRDLLLSRRAQQRGIVEARAVQRLLAEHDRGRDHSSQIWSLLWLEAWARRWLDR